MKIRILGGGWYGCHLAKHLLDAGYEVVLHEQRGELFRGASGANPARLHLGFHYPRSGHTRIMCQQNYKMFMGTYGHFTRLIPINIYAVAALDSMVDYQNYVKVLRDEVQFIEVDRPEELGLTNVEGAVLTGERHILINKVRDYFNDVLSNIVSFNTPPLPDEDGDWDLTIDCTFCRLSGTGIHRYEPCITHVLAGNYNKAVTIMDGPFPSVYPHYEPGHVSLTSAKFTPLSKSCKTWNEAKGILDGLSTADVMSHLKKSSELMQHFYPSVKDYKYVASLFAVRAMPRSGADTRPWAVDTTAKKNWVVKAGKIDAVFNVASHVSKLLELL